MPKKLHTKVMKIQDFQDTKNLWFSRVWSYLFCAYDLPGGWRLVYTIKEDEITILNVILEWFNHKGYEKRFNY
jgi:hypothetical protein